MDNAVADLPNVGSFESVTLRSALVEAWLRARSVARGLPQPVREHGGFRVDSNLPQEVVRWVFAEPVPAIRTLAAALDRPRCFLKLIGEPVDLQALLDARWQLQPQSHFMIRDRDVEAPSRLPDGYTLAIETTGPNSVARIHDRSGDLAASGYAAEFAGVFAYDRIVTDPGHRRRGLGRQLMAALASTRKSPAAAQVLVASEDGRALYASIGWSGLYPYSSAVIPSAPD